MTDADTPGGEAHVEHFRVAIIGAGFSGVGVAARLRQQGIEDFVLLERADDLGGTWRDNDYPGLCCDIPSHVYSYSFALQPHWTRGFSPGWEIHHYLKQTAEKQGVIDHLRLGHAVREAAWDEAAGRWAVKTSAGDFTSDVLINAAGPLSDPTSPDIPGLAEFQGTRFHSAEWDHDHDLAGERVAVIGTGASAIQFVPQIQPQVGRLFLFQRTPPWVMPRLDHEITAPEHWGLRWVPFAPQMVRAFLYWLMEIRVIGFRKPWIMRLASRVVKAHLKRQIKDDGLRAKLTPDYVMGCKRILISDNYYPALTQDNVEVVTDGVAEVRARSVVTNSGREIEVDTIIFGTGFHVTDPPIAKKIRGRDGRTLAEHWEGSMQAYKGTTVAGFPNMFFILGPNTGLGHNSQIYMVESQIAYIIDGLQTLQQRGARFFEVRREAQDRYNDELQKQMKGTVWTAGNCHSWYLDDSGRNTTLWPTWTFEFRRRTRRFDAAAYELAGA